MKFYSALFFVFFLCFGLTLAPAHATVDGALSGTVLDDKGVAVPNAKVTITGNGVEKDLVASATGTFQAFPLTLGDYQIQVQADGFSPYKQTVAVSGNTSSLAVVLLPAGEMQMTVKAKHLVSSAPDSSRALNKDDIAQLPGGTTTNLPKLLYTTTAGFVEGDFGQVFTRGNHANLQYQIDGIQLPDSVGGSFGEAFTPVNIDHMEILTGGLQPEFGTRMAGVVNIVTKSGTITPGGEIGLSYGSYNQTSNYASYGGSDASGAFHYLLSASSFYTDRGLDTPAPADINNDQNGGSEQAVHDKSYGTDAFLKLDWVADNANKLDLVAFSEDKFFQIPDYPSSFDPGGANFQYFLSSGDIYGNVVSYVPSTTNDTQAEANKYIELAWRHTFGDDSFLQIAPYWKESNITFTNDPQDDLAAAYNTQIQDQNSGTPFSVSSFSEDRTSDNYGTQADYTWHADANNLVKIGGQALLTQSSGPVSVTEANFDGTPGDPVTVDGSGDSSTDVGYQEGLYIQDEMDLAKGVVLSGGVRFDAIQFTFPGATSNDSLLEPRIGLSLLPSDGTKIHFFYGKLFMPAPPEDLRDTFVNLGQGNSLTPYDLKAEKDDYFETGIAQQVDNQLFTLNAYYKYAVNMLDENQLLNTAIAQPFNFASGYAYGIEFSMRGEVAKDWTDFANYSYEIAKGQGISGGIFAFPPGTDFEPGVYQFLDHCQIHTANAGLTYNPGDIWVTAEGLFGGGLSTGPDNTLRLPSHFTMDATVGYAFQKDSGLSGMKASLDVLNLFDNPYTIFIANGYNGNHYENGREFIFRLSKAL
ncbi:MAG TPA: TonB-dependent receptor [bacterium]|nr:TonB-dependent receptor [bacterium]